MSLFDGKKWRTEKQLFEYFGRFFSYKGHEDERNNKYWKRYWEQERSCRRGRAVTYFVVTSEKEPEESLEKYARFDFLLGHGSRDHKGAKRREKMARPAARRRAKEWLRNVLRWRHTPSHKHRDGLTSDFWGPIRTGTTGFRRSSSPIWELAPPTPPASNGQGFRIKFIELCPVLYFEFNCVDGFEI